MKIFDPSRLVSAKAKNIFITGANCGIGFETAKELLIRGANVTIGCRNETKMNETISKLQVEKSGKISGIVIDLKNFDAVRVAASDLEQRVPHLDVLILNAGIMRTPLELSDGLELHQKVNHFSHFLLTNQLLQLLKAAPSRPRVVSVSSVAHMFASGNSEYWKKFESKDAYFSAGLKDPLKRREPYGESKLANICHMHELAKLNPEIGCFSLHPGVVRTELQRKWRIAQPIAFNLSNLFMTSPYKGAQTTLYCTLAPELDDPKFSGLYFSDSNPAKTRFLNPKMAEELWKISEIIVKD